MAAKDDKKLKVVADNRKARFNYFIDETFEAGVSLTGTEVKSLRQGKATIAEAYADARDGEIDDIAPHGKFLELVEHLHSSPCSDRSAAIRSRPAQARCHVSRPRCERNARSPRQLIRPAWTMASRTAVCAFSVAGTMGKRTLGEHFPISDNAYLIGAGEVSTKRFMCNGASLS